MPKMLKTEDIIAIQSQDARVLEFILYIRFIYKKWCWLSTRNMGKIFIIDIIRTTNNCESFHRKWNSFFNSSHPNIFNFIDILKNTHIDTYIALRSQGSRNRITIEKEGYIIKKMEELETKKNYSNWICEANVIQICTYFYIDL